MTVPAPTPVRGKPFGSGSPLTPITPLNHITQITTLTPITPITPITHITQITPLGHSRVVPTIWGGGHPGR